MRQYLLLIALLHASAGAQTAEDLVRDRVTQGPAHYCANSFAIDLEKGEKLTRRIGPDFLVYFIENPGGAFGIYDGFAPDADRSTATPVALPRFGTIERLWDKEAGYSYLIALPHHGAATGSEPQFYLHLFGPAWKGDSTDLARIARVRVGSAAEIGCARASDPDPWAASHPEDHR